MIAGRSPKCTQTRIISKGMVVHWLPMIIMIAVEFTDGQDEVLLQKNLTHQNEGCVTGFFPKNHAKMAPFACLIYSCSNCMLHLHFLEFFVTELLSLQDHKIGRLPYNPPVTRYHATDHNYQELSLLLYPRVG